MLSMLDFLLMLQVKLPIVDIIHIESKKFATGVCYSPALPLRLLKSCCTFTSISYTVYVWYWSAVFKTNSFVALFMISGPQNDNRPSDRVRKKTENYAEIFGNIMRKKVTIMRKRHQIMRKFLQFN